MTSGESWTASNDEFDEESLAYIPTGARIGASDANPNADAKVHGSSADLATTRLRDLGRSKL